MSKEIIFDDDMTSSSLNSNTVMCKQHQVLNKYYLKNKGIFVCEYDGVEEEDKNSFMHMPQILQMYHDEIIDLQNHPEYFEPKAFSKSIPTYSKSIKKLNVDVSKFNYDYEKFVKEIYPKMIQFIKANYSLLEIKDLVKEVKFNPNKTPDFKQIGMNDQKEQKVLMLAQYLVLQGKNKNQKTDLLESYKQFLEEYQFKMVDMIFASLDFLDLSYNVFMPEIAKLEKKEIGEIKNKDFLKSHITTKKATDSLIQKYKDAINSKDEELRILRESFSKEKNQIMYLEDSNRDLKKKINDLQNSSKEKDNANRDRIDELEIVIFNLRQENEEGGKDKLRLQNDSIQKIKQDHESEINKIKVDNHKFNENQKKDFDDKLNLIKNQNIELEKNHKSIGFLVNDSINQANIKRIRELESILQDERQRRELILNESDKKIKDSNNLYINTAKEFENYKKLNLEHDTRIKDLTGRLNFLEKENENMKHNLTEKEALMFKNNEEHKNIRLSDKKNHEADLLKLKDHEVMNAKFKKDLAENENYKIYFDKYVTTKRDHDKNLCDKDILLNNNQTLQKELDLIKKENERIHRENEKDNEKLRNNFEKAESLNNNLNLQLNDKNRKLELIQKQTEQLREKLKPYPWAQNAGLNKMNGVSLKSNK